MNPNNLANSHTVNSSQKEKRMKVVSVRLTKSEEFILMNKAKLARIDLSVLLRNSALKREIKQRLSEEDRVILRNLINTSTNLNTLARNSHKQNMMTMMRELLSLRERINLLIDKLHD